MAADVFESFEVTLLSAIILGAATGAVLNSETWPKLILFALTTAGIGIIASMVGITLVKGDDNVDSDPLKPILGGFRIGAALAAAGTFALAFVMMQGITSTVLIPTKQFESEEAVKIRQIRDRIAKSLNKANYQVKASEVVDDPEFKGLKIPTGTDIEKNAATAQVGRAISTDSDAEAPIKSLSGYQRILPSDFAKASFKAGEFAFPALPPTDPAAAPTAQFIPAKERFSAANASNLVALQIKIEQKGPDQRDAKGKITAPGQSQTAVEWYGPAIRADFEKQIQSSIDQAKSQGSQLTVSILQAPKFELFYNNKTDKFALGLVSNIERPSQLRPLPGPDRGGPNLSYFRLPASSMEKVMKDIQSSPDQRNAAVPPSYTLEVGIAKETVVPWWSFGLAVSFGILMAIVIEAITNYYVGANNRPTRDVAGVSTAGPAPMIIQGFAFGAESSVFMVLAIVVTLLLPLYLFPSVLFGSQILGFYGVALVGLGLLTTTGYVLAMDTFGPISDNAQGVFEMSGEGKDNISANKSLQRLDAAGNTTKALTKGFAIATAVVASVALFHSYVESAQLENIGLRLEIPEIFLGLLLGASVPFLFSAFAINAVGRSAFELITEVRAQFHAKPGILEGTETPDYGKCVAIVTAAAQRELVGPGILAICAPIAVGFGFAIGKPSVEIGGMMFNLSGAQALGGFLAGAIASGQLMAVLLSNSGGMWDNAKKLIEDGMFGGKGTDAHKAAVICDTVGDPFKDTAGPAMNPLIKVMNLVGLLLAGVVIQPLPTIAQVIVTLIAVGLLAFAVYRSKQGSLSESFQSVKKEDLTDVQNHGEDVPAATPKKKRITVGDDTDA